MATLPTVKIRADNQRGYIIINESDFDPEVHDRYGSPPDAAAETEGEFTPPFATDYRGGGITDIKDAEGEVYDSVRGKEKAQAIADELNADY